MANFLTKASKSYGPMRTGVTGSFTTANTSNPTTSDLNGIVSITRTGVGVFRITLQDAAKEYNVQLTRQCTAALSVNQAVVSAISLTNKTIDVTIAASGAAADTTGVTVHVKVEFRVTN